MIFPAGPGLSGGSVNRSTEGTAVPVISTLIEPRRVTRVFFDCRNAAPDPGEQRRIEQAIVCDTLVEDT